MKKTLLLLAMCFVATVFAYAQDDDVYFVPSSKNKQTNSSDTYEANPGQSTFSPIGNGGNSSAGSDVFSQSNWADNRRNSQWDVDAYNRRGKSYKGNASSDSLTAQSLYNEGYNDGYEDGSCTARIVRFWSPRAGIYVSSPYWMDYADLYGYYDPFYYGYGSAWSLGWSSWWGWGSWYGYRPYYSYHWGWHEPWYDAWWGGPVGGHGFHSYMPPTAQRGPVGGWTNRGGARGSGPVVGYASNRGFESGRGGSNGSTVLGGRGFGVRGGANGSQPSSNVGTLQQNRNSGGFLGGRGFGNSTQQRSNVNTNMNTNSGGSFTGGRGGGNLGGRGFSAPSGGSRGGAMGGGGGFGGRGGGRGR